MAEAKGKKRAKDLDPKAKAKKVRGGNLPDDEQNINRSLNQIKGTVNSKAVKPVQNSGPTIQRAVKGLVR